jgi:MFS family permease
MAKMRRMSVENNMVEDPSSGLIDPDPLLSDSEGIAAQATGTAVTGSAPRRPLRAICGCVVLLVSLCCHTQQPGLLPVWWLFVLASWAPPQELFWGLIQSVIVPFQVAVLVGDKQKQVALGYVATANQLGKCWGPCIGTWSDRCDSRCGRRRPFMLAGPVCFCGALLILQHARALEIFAAGMFSFSLTAAVQCAPFNAILPEIVPPEQRSLAGGIQSWTSTIASQLGSAIGILVGRQCPSNEMVSSCREAFDSVFYAGMFVNLLLVAPLGVLVVGRGPCHRRRCLVPEPVPAIDPSVQQRAGRPCCLRFSAACLHFFDALRYPPYFWLSVVSVMQTLWSNLQGLFYFYWFEDVIAPNFDVLGHRITNSTVSAVAINSATGTLGAFVFSIPGGILGDRYGRHAVLMSTGYMTCAFPMINAFLPSYSWILLCSVLGGIVSGVSAGAANALNADCMPCDASGRPINAGRDRMLLGAFSQLASAIIPPILGHAFGFFHSRAFAYKCFFLCAAGLHFLSVTMLLLIDPEAARQKLRFAQSQRSAVTRHMMRGQRTAEELAELELRGCGGGRRGWIWALGVMALLFAFGGGICVREAVVYRLRPWDNNSSVVEGKPSLTVPTGALDRFGMHMCGTLATELPANSLRWHRGALLGALFLAAAALLAISAAGCHSIRRRRRLRFAESCAVDIQNEAAEQRMRASRGGLEAPRLRGTLSSS